MTDVAVLPLEWKLIGGLVLVAALIEGAEWKLAAARAEGRASCEQAHQAASIAEERRRVEALAEVANEAQRMQNHVRADAGVARASLGRLLQRARGNGLRYPAAAAPSAPASAAGDLQGVPDVLGGIGEAARQLAAGLDEARAAGLACERAFDKVRGTP